MPVITEAAAQARVVARRGASAAATLIGASFHPFRTVREGAHVVRGLMHPPENPIPGAPTDAQEAPVTAPPATSTPPGTSDGQSAASQSAQSDSTEATTKATAGASDTAAPADTTPPTATPPTAGADTVATPPSPPDADVVPPEDLDDRPLDARGPAPHIPPRIAGEVERDYGDDLPGFKNGEG